MKSLIKKFFSFYYKDTIESHIALLEAEKECLEERLKETTRELAEARLLLKLNK